MAGTGRTRNKGIGVKQVSVGGNLTKVSMWSADSRPGSVDGSQSVHAMLIVDVDLARTACDKKAADTHAVMPEDATRFPGVLGRLACSGRKNEVIVHHNLTAIQGRCGTCRPSMNSYHAPGKLW
jgi:hypothetical protein